MAFNIFNIEALTKSAILKMFVKNNNLTNLGIVPVGDGHCSTTLWVIIEKGKLPPKRCSKHGDQMMVYKTETDTMYCKEGTLFYSCDVVGCLEKLYPLYPHNQLNKELTMENPPALLY